MTWVQPLVGHLLSQYAETRLEGLQKLKRMLMDPEEKCSAANTYVADAGALQALLAVSAKLSATQGATSATATAGQDQRLQEESLRVLKLLMDSATGANRMLLARTLCGRALFPMIRGGLMDISEGKLQVTLMSLSLLASVARHCPRVVLGRFHGDVPLHLPCFRSQLTFSVRRVRQARLQFLVSLATSKHLGTTKTCLKTPGFLTQLMEDAAELLRQGDEGGTMETVVSVLDVMEHHFLKADWMDVAEKRETVMNQRSILKILVRAMKLDTVGDRAASILKFMVDSFQEPSRDYAIARTEADDKGMPNFGVFTILRLLKPHQSAREAGLLCYILQQCPDLIRPYFVRCSREMVEHQKGGATEGLMEAVAVVNTMTRILMAPLPYHLSEHAGSLAPSDASTNRFFSLTPQNAAEEVCPLWLGEFVHKLINHNDNLLLLAWAMQVTQAAINRALHVAALVRQIHAQQHLRAVAAMAATRAAPSGAVGASLGSFDMTPSAFASNADSAGSLLIDIDAYESEMTMKLATFLPRREEFWHRVTQQLHGTLVLTDTQAPQHAKGQFIMQRMAVLMHGYTDLFRLRIPWLSVLPPYTPTVDRNSTITSLLKARSDVVLTWEPKTVSSLCSLLCSNLARGVALSKLHHVTLGNVSGQQPLLSEWPMLLSLLLWFIRHRQDIASADVSEALAYICRLTLLCVHTVTTRYSAEMEEVFLWLQSVNEETAPCLLHVINLMFMRGTSKAAERVAAESANAEFGILIENAKLLVKNTREKRQQKAADAAAGAPAKASRPNLWQLDLETNLDAFERLTAKVETSWSTRATGYQKIAATIALHAAQVSVGKKRLGLAVTRETTSVLGASSDDASWSQHTSPAALQQLLVRYLAPQKGQHALTDLGASAADDDAPTNPETLQQWLRIRNASSFKDLQKLLCKDREMAGAWMSSSPLAWAVVRRVGILVAPNTHVASTAHDEETAASTAEAELRNTVEVELPAFSRKLLAFLVNNRDVWAPSPVDGDASLARSPLFTGLMVLVLIGLESVLRQYQHIKDSEPLDATILEHLTSIALARYTGSLKITDRLSYAVLLLLDYMMPSASHTTFHTQPTQVALEAEGAASGSDDDAEDVASAGSASSDDDEDAAAAEATSRTVQPSSSRKPKMSKKNKKKSSSSHGVVVSGCMCPCGIVNHRFVTAGVALHPRMTTEVDVLHQLVDGMTDADANRLDVPLTLSTSVFVKRTDTPAALRATATGVLASVWALVFPDMASAKDRVARHALSTAPSHISEDAMDPRYLLPLAVTVGSIGLQHPSSVPPHVVTRCFNVALRSLSSTCPNQRRMASTVLACCYPSLAPMKRSVLNFTRLRLLHLEAALASRGIARREASAPLRLPASLTSFLILAQEPMQRYQHPLHNHMVNYFDTEAKQHLVSSSDGNKHHSNSRRDDIPMIELLSGFPLGCVTHSLVRSKEESLLAAAHHPSAAARKNDMVAAGRVRLIETLQATEPVHLEFVFHLLKHGSSGVASDTTLLMQSRALSSLMSLFTMSSAAPHIRTGALEALRSVCLASGAAAWSCAIEGQVLSWLCATLTMLVNESENDLESGSEASTLFIRLLELTETMLRTMQEVAGGATSMRRQLQSQQMKVRCAMQTLRRRLSLAGISSKATWDAVGAVMETVAAVSSQ